MDKPDETLKTPCEHGKRALAPEVVTSVLREHVALMRSSTDWGIAIAIAIMLCALANTKTVVFGVPLTETIEYLVAAGIYSAVILALSLQLFHIAFLLKVAEKILEKNLYEERSVELVVPVVAFPWLLNPFSYFSYGRSQQLSASLGAACLIVAWWIGLGGLLLIEPTGAPWYVTEIPRVLMIAFGFLVVCGVASVLQTISYILKTNRPPGQAERLLPYEDTVDARLGAIQAAQLICIATYWLVSIFRYHRTFYDICLEIGLATLLFPLLWLLRGEFHENLSRLSEASSEKKVPSK